MNNYYTKSLEEQGRIELPVDWLKENKLKKDDEFSLYSLANMLLFVPHAGNETEETKSKETGQLRYEKIIYKILNTSLKDVHNEIREYQLLIDAYLEKGLPIKSAVMSKAIDSLCIARIRESHIKKSLDKIYEAVIKSLEYNDNAFEVWVEDCE